MDFQEAWVNFDQFKFYIIKNKIFTLLSITVKVFGVCGFYV